MTTHEPVRWRNEQQGTSGAYCKWCHADWPCARATDAVHVLPTNDVVEHADTDACVCGPTSDAVKRPDGSVGWVVIHHSLDGRESR